MFLQLDDIYTVYTVQRTEAEIKVPNLYPYILPFNIVGLRVKGSGMCLSDLLQSMLTGLVIKACLTWTVITQGCTAYMSSICITYLCLQVLF